MPDFFYKAADATGTITKGVRFAHNREELIHRMRESGLHLLEAREAKARQLLKFLEGIQVGGLNRRQLIDFSNNMAVMLRAGIPLVNALDELREDAESKYMKNVLSEIIENIQEGDSLHEALAKRPRDFPNLYVNVVAIGEQTGNLDSVFLDLAQQYKRIDDLIRNVRKALIYPSFVFVAVILAAFVFLTMVFPPLFTMLKEFDVPLPTVTKVLIAVSGTMKAYWGVMLAATIGFVILFLVLRRFEKPKYYIDWSELSFPYLRRVFIQMRMTFFLRYFAMLLIAGMDILRSLDLAIRSVNNSVIRKVLDASRQRVIEGELISDSLRGVRFVPHMVIRMIAIGEESGNLPEQMEYVANYYNEELERRIAAALAIMEPVLIMVLAGLALSLVMGVLLPIYNLVSQLSGAVGGG